MLIHRYLIKSLIPVFLVSLLLFTLFVQTLDIFVNFLRYLYEDVPWATIAQIQLLYVPQSITYALPVALLFSVSFTMSTLYSHNELIAVYAAGVSLIRFVVPLLLLAAAISAGNFFFREYVVIDTFRQKNELMRVSLNQDLKRSNANAAVLQAGGNILYKVDFYNDVELSLVGVTVLQLSEQGDLMRRVDAQSASWNGTQWVFNDARVFTYSANPELAPEIATDIANEIDGDGAKATPENAAAPQTAAGENVSVVPPGAPGTETSPRAKYGGTVTLTRIPTLSEPVFNLEPSNFQSIVQNTGEMKYGQALRYARQLKESGLSYRKILADTYGRIPLAVSPFIVVLIACFAANAYGKNTFFVSLLVSLIMAVIYYSIDLFGSVLVSRFIVPPLVGAWMGTALIVLLSLVLYKATSR